MAGAYTEACLRRGLGHAGGRPRDLGRLRRATAATCSGGIYAGSEPGRRVWRAVAARTLQCWNIPPAFGARVGKAGVGSSLRTAP
jgi:hypothetical protein